MAECESFHFAREVSIEKESDGWMLSVKWIPHSSETQRLEKIAAKHNLELAESKVRTVFHSKNPANLQFELST